MQLEPTSGIGLAESILITIGVMIAGLAAIGVFSYALSRSQAHPFRQVFTDASPLAFGVASLILVLFLPAYAVLGAVAGVAAFLWGQAVHRVARATGGSTGARLAGRAGQVLGGISVAIWLFYLYFMR